jgi:hypothetical protein
MSRYAIFVYQLPDTTEDYHLWECFPNAVEYHRVVDRQCNRFFGTAFVLFSTAKHAEKATIGRRTILGKEIRVQLSEFRSCLDGEEKTN